MKKILFIFILTLVGQVNATSQDFLELGSVTTAQYNSIIYAIPGDTIFYTTWQEAVIEDVCPSRHKKVKFDRLMRKVIKVYPYSKVAGEVMKECEAQFLEITDENKRKELLDLAEDEMKRQFENDLRALTVSEGIILIKLIDRETGNTSFELVQQLKGRFSAFMWQSVARIFGHDLKDNYDGAGEDVWIENVCQMIENGEIAVDLKTVDPFLIRQFSHN